MKVWLPTVKAGSGSDVFVKRLAVALIQQGLEAEITWFDRRYEFAPWLLKNTASPVGTNIIMANSWNGFAFKRAGIPLVIIEHHCVLDPGLKPYKSLCQHVYHTLLIKNFEHLSFSRASHVVAVSQYTASSLLQVFGLQNVSVIPNWVSMGQFLPDKAGKVKSEKPFRLLFVGNLIKRKGADLLAQIMNELGDDFHLSFTTGLRSASNDNYPANMTPLGHLSEPELIHEYQYCDALLFPSRFEGFGYVVLEAMACGKPVISSDNTSLPELVGDGENGILCPTDNIDSFVAACRALAADRSRCKKMGEAGRQKAGTKFTEAYNGARYVAMFEAVLSGTIK